MPAAPSDPTTPPTGRATARPGRREAGAPSTTRRPRLASDNVRYVVALAVTAALAATYGGVVRAVAPETLGSLRFVVTVYFGAWCAYSLVYVGLTWAALRAADGQQLAEWLAEDRSVRRRRRRAEWLAGSGGPLGAISFCAAAVGAVVVATVLPALREDPVVITLAVAVVVASWLLITGVYAVHYAREDADHGGLAFGGAAHEGAPQLADYVYLAVQVGTAYNGADVVTTTRAVRRTITVHAVVAFVFNTVLIALLVSLLITATT